MSEIPRGLRLWQQQAPSEDEAKLISYDVYYADGRTLHFLCVIEAPSQEVAKQLVRESVPSECCESVVVRRREY
jgi:hypothetical protein